MNFSVQSRTIIGIMLITVVTVEWGGTALLSNLRRRTGGYGDNGVQQHYFRAGHAHAGVLLILAMLAQVLIDQTSIASVLAYALRVGFFLPPILFPVGYFLGAPDASGKPKPILGLVYVGGLSLAISTVALGIALLIGA